MVGCVWNIKGIIAFADNIFSAKNIQNIWTSFVPLGSCGINIYKKNH